MEKEKRYYECGNGWLPLIEEAEKIIQEWNEKHKIDNKETDTWGGEFCELVQIKEKWGELCLYCNVYPDEIFDKMMDLTKRSRHICEECGTENGVTTEWTHGWVFTLCPECRKKELERWNKITNKIKD